MTSDEGARQGHCLCGDCTYAYEGKPLWTAYCHCESCRRATASPATTFLGVAAEGFRWTGAKPAVFESSPGVRRRFCGRCGTPLAYEADQFPGEVHLYVATLNDPATIVPRGHVHVAEQIPWFEVLDALPRYATTGTDKTVKPVSIGPGPRDDS